ncbi:MAG TPA: hypothetical protein VG651_20155 [Stellaceae bacterium]|nr:hypothetical protein [Stellaceae bacterium]
MSYPSVVPHAYQIDVVDQVGRAYRAVFDRLRLVAEMALLPYAIVLAAELVALLMPGGVTGGILAVVVRAAGFLLFGSVFLVRWHRLVLLDERAGNGFVPPGWTDFVIAEIKLGAILLAGWLVMVALAVLPPHFLTVVLATVGGVALTLAVARVSLVFPAAAVEQPIGLRTAWDWVGGNFWRLFACALAAYFPFLVAGMVITAIGGVFPSLLWMVFEALRLAVSFVGLAVVAALLSQLYRDIGRNKSPG